MAYDLPCDSACTCMQMYEYINNFLSNISRLWCLRLILSLSESCKIRTWFLLLSGRSGLSNWSETLFVRVCACVWGGGGGVKVASPTLESNSPAIATQCWSLFLWLQDKSYCRTNGHSDLKSTYDIKTRLYANSTCCKSKGNVRTEINTLFKSMQSLLLTVQSH